jgi:hypothetical protein
MPEIEPGPILTDRIIGLAIKVHRKLGPGLLEAVYHHCLCWELRHANLEFEREVPLAVIYEDTRLNQGYFADGGMPSISAFAGAGLAGMTGWTQIVLQMTQLFRNGP